MSQFCEALEGRCLFSASLAVLVSDISTLQVQVGTARTDVRSAKILAASDARTVVKDLRGTGSTNSALARVLKRDVQHELGALQKHANRAVQASNRSIHQILSALKQLEKNESNPRAAGKLAKASAKLQTQIGGMSLLNDANSFNTRAMNDLNAVAGANPGITPLQGDIAKAQTDLTNINTQLTGDATTLQTQTTTYTTDLSA